MASLRAAVITDIHYGFDHKDKLGSKAPKLMKQFVKAMQEYKPDFVVDIGDRISAKSKEDDRHYLKELKKHFNNISAPHYPVIGNHDIRFLEREENEKILGAPSNNYTQDVNGYHLVFWNPQFQFGETGIDIFDEDIEWLEKDLKKHKDQKTILFSHVPLDNLGDEGIEDITKYFFWSQGDRVRKVLEDAGNVILCMHGHRHRNRHREINGIHYVTQQAFTSQWRKHYRIPSRTYSLLEIDDDKINIYLKGKFEKHYELN